MDSIKIAVTRELNVEDLYKDLLYWIPEWDTISEAHITEDDINDETITDILSAIINYIKGKGE